MTGVFVNAEECVQIVCVIGQIAEDFDLLGSLKYRNAAGISGIAYYTILYALTFICFHKLCFDR